MGSPLLNAIFASGKNGWKTFDISTSNEAVFPAGYDQPSDSGRLFEYIKRLSPLAFGLLVQDINRPRHIQAPLNKLLGQPKEAHGNSRVHSIFLKLKAIIITVKFQSSAQNFQP